MLHPVRAMAVLLTMTLAAPMASAYYHWVFFAQRGGPYTAMRLRFNLNELQDSTVRYFVPTRGPEPMMPGDSYASLIGQIRAAGRAWNNVSTSALRVEFGGVVDEPQPGTQTAPGIDIVFDDDMPPGVLAQSLPVTHADLSYLGRENSPGFAPILRAKLQLRRDLTARQQASHSDAFFLTIVHEFGHTLGLQHSLTSAAMSTSITRATTKAQPLSADDVAAISLLYPVANYAASTGAIAGHVRVDGTGVNLASVVALGVDGRAIGTLTNPDGTYRIEGLPPGGYRVYAHPLPPALQDEGLPAAIQPPLDLSGNAFPAVTSFETKFWPGTKDWTQAAVFDVFAGAAVEGADFDLAHRAAPAIHSMQAYVYMGDKHDIAVHSAAVPVGDRRFFAFNGAGVYQPNSTQFAPGLNLSVIGGPVRLEPETMRYFGQGYSLIVMNAEPVEKPTSVAVAFTANDDLYVLPSAMTIVPTAAPSVSGVRNLTDDQGRAVAILEGANLGLDTRVLFDGLRGENRGMEDGRLLVTAPAAAGKHQAAITVLSGVQSSGQLGGNPPRFLYNAPENPSIVARPGILSAGVDLMIEVEGIGTDFQPGQTVVGFGSSDIVVRQVWVVNRSRLLANVSVSSAALPGLTKITVATGLQIASEWISIGPRAAEEISLHVPATSVRTGLAGVAPGEVVFLGTKGVPADFTGWQVLVYGVKAEAVRVEGGLHVTVPNSTPQGAVKVQLAPPGGRYIDPVLIQVDSPPPVILQVVGQRAAQGRVDVLAGDRVKVIVVGLFEEAISTAAALSQIELKAGGAVHAVESLKAAGAGQELEFVLRGDVPAGVHAISVRVGTRQSLPVWINVLPGEAKALAQ